MISVSLVLLTLAFGKLAGCAPAASSSASSPASSSAVVSSSTSQVASTVVSSTIPSAVSSAPAASATVEPISTEPNGPLWGIDTSPDDPVVQPVRGKLGVPVMGPDNKAIDVQNPDFLAGPSTDHGSVKNAKWPFSLSHNRLQTGGWARQENIGVMPIATEMASVNMRLEPGAVRELHWHKTSEWAYVLKGSTQITAVDAEGRNYIATVQPGDIWFFPAGVPHSLQATDDDPEGSEFILVFDDGDFSEDSTFLLTDWLNHIPYEVIQKNFGVTNDAFSHIPNEELYIFPVAQLPQDDGSAPQSPQGTVPDPYSFALSKVNATITPGGSVKVVDSTTFKVSTTIAAAEVTVNPGGIRELHWHPTMDEWSFFIEGQGRVTIFASQGNARTFDYQAGDIGYVPTAMGHYVENIGNTTLRFLEIFNTDRFQDISLNQWLALTPPDLVKAHLNIDDDTISKLSKTKPIVMGPAN
ncbi:oxalate decarboxylase [Moniliophthora roreri MCA 2997]|uniref:Oxalate decarboxylase n=1 Tax=Moniliophthora roreri (strain MCA 2997) TaxID=1381753 RepID=V2X6R9_MONRO|nr:oxalate decarboxylase [Moniliophthora roreri MCA 2997]